MRRPLIEKKKIEKAGQYFHTATRRHYRLWFTGEDKQVKRINVMLPLLVCENKLYVYKYGKFKLYVVPRIDQRNGNLTNIEHELACTECLVRFHRSNMDANVISEKEFRGLGVVPEWGIKFDKKLLLFEFCTLANFEKSGLVRNKVLRYQDSFDLIKEKFKAEPHVLFVINVDQERIERFVDKLKPLPEFYFCDYETFLKQEIGYQLKAKIYIWGEDGSTDSF